MIFLVEKSANPYKVQPSYTFWAPWIGHRSRNGNVVYNTEHRKCNRIPPEDVDSDDAEQNIVQNAPSEEELVEMMHFAQVIHTISTLSSS